MHSRTVAALTINQVINHRNSLTRVLEQYSEASLSQQDRAFISELCYGVIRWYQLLENNLNQLLNKPLRQKDNDIKQLLLIGLYQIDFLSTPEHAAVSATVNACNELDKAWAKNLVNAVLRSYIRKQPELKTSEDIAILYSHPDWMVKQLKQDWSQHWQDIIKANQLHAPLTLRINQTKIQRHHYLEKLNAVNINAEETKLSKTGITIVEPCDVKTLPGYSAGEFSVQDEAAQFAALLMDLRPGDRVLDACAAPGGKTSHCLEIQTDLDQLIALDNNSTRLKKVTTNLERLGLHATVHCGNASDPDAWWDQQPFDRILIDAPCTASGIIRRHPDIKFLREACDLHTIADEQQSLLENIWRVLDNNGRLVYSTCSIFKSENDKQIERFLQNHKDAELFQIQADWGTPTNFGRQILPGENNMDGFYYSCIIKK